MISFGNILSDIKAFFIGSTSVSKVFYQGVKVWPSTESGYLIFRAQGSAPITVGLASRSSVQTTLEYSSDNGATWNNMTTADSFTISTTGTTDVWVRGKQTGNQSDSNFTQFTTSGTGRMRLVGNINALWAYNDITGENIRSYCAYRMFEDCANIRSLSNLTMPSTQLANSCYMRTFRGCTDMSAVPAGLLPATELATASYRGLFYGCTSLTSGPELPATELGSYCYREMFYGCTALTTAPELPATTLASNCYDRMFRGATALTSAPELPAPILATSCYDSMFRDCTSLNYIKCLATDISASNCTSNWVNNVAPTGRFAKAADMSDWVIDSVNGIPIGWTIDGNTNYIKVTALADTTMRVARRAENQTELSYSADRGLHWNELNEGNTVLINSGSTIYMRGIKGEREYNGDYTNIRFNNGGSVKLSGKINNMWSYDNPKAPLKAYCGESLFRGAVGEGVTGEIDARELTFPSDTLSEGCYFDMFLYSHLTKAPRELPAMNLAKYCYAWMFAYTEITKGPVLPASEMAERCYENMFDSANELNYITVLADEVSESGYTSSWVNNVASAGTFCTSEKMYRNWPRSVSGEPSNWITYVDYGGYTPLPNGAYFKAVDGVTPQFDLGINAKTLYRFYGSLAPMVGGGEGVFWATGATSDNADCRLFFTKGTTTSTGYMDYGTGRSYVQSPSDLNWVKRHIEVEMVHPSSSQYRLDVICGDRYRGNVATYNVSNAPDSNIVLGGAADEFILYELKFYNSQGETIGWWVPVLDGNNRVRIYDRVTRKLLTELNGVSPQRA